MLFVNFTNRHILFSFMPVPTVSTINIFPALRSNGFFFAVSSGASTAMKVLQAV